MSEQDDRPDELEGQPAPDASPSDQPEPQSGVEPGDLPAGELDDAAVSSDLPEPESEVMGLPEVEPVGVAAAMAAAPLPREELMISGGPARRGPRWVLPLVVMLAIGAIAAVVVTQGLLGVDPPKLLAAAVKQYQTATSLEAKGQTIVDISMSGMQQKIDMPVDMAFQKPNLFAMDQGKDQMHVVAVSDGTFVYSQLEMLKMVVKAPAPKDLAAMEEVNAMGGLGQFTEQVPSTMGMASGRFDPADFEVTAGIDAADEWLAGLPPLQGTVPVTVKSKEGLSTAMWINRRTKLIERLALRFGGEQFAKMMGQDMTDDAMAGQMAEMFKTMSVQVLVTYESQRLNPQLPAERFAYQPPEGYKVIETDSLSQDAMMEAMMGAAGESGEGQAPQEEKNLEGQAPSDFEAQTLDGAKVKLSSLKGQPIVLDFWATWCPPCREEMPILNKLYGALKDQGVQVVAVSTDSELDVVPKFLEENPVDFTIWWLDPATAQQVSEAYGITGIPRTLYIGKDWTIVDDTTGLHPEKAMIESFGALGLDVSKLQ